MPSSPDRAADGPTLRESVPSVREWASTFLVGIVMGSADAVPGVSGGTIALIAGIYERLITAVTAVTPGRVLGFLRALTPLGGGVSTREAVGIFDEVDGWFLVALLVGIVSAVVVVTRVVHWADQNYPTLLFGFFFGLIAASAVVLWRAVSVRTTGTAVAAVAGFAVAFALSGEAQTLADGGLALVFVAGAVAVSAMILPGISGSLMLVVLGQYTYLSGTLSTFVDRLGALAGGGAVEALVGPGSVVVTFLGGGLIGLFTVSRVVRAALDRNREATLAFLVALVVGALRAPVVEVQRSAGGFTPEVAVVFLGAAAVGAVAVLGLDWRAADFDVESV